MAFAPGTAWRPAGSIGRSGGGGGNARGPAETGLALRIALLHRSPAWATSGKMRPGRGPSTIQGHPSFGTSPRSRPRSGYRASGSGSDVSVALGLVRHKRNPAVPHDLDFGKQILLFRPCQPHGHGALFHAGNALGFFQ